MLPPSHCVVQYSTFFKPSSSACGGCYLLLSSRVSSKFLVGVPDYGQALVRYYSSPSKCSEILSFSFCFFVTLRRLVGTILAPTPFIAANFLTLGRIIDQLGPQYSRLSPKLCILATYTAVLLSDQYIQTLLSSFPS